MLRLPLLAAVLAALAPSVQAQSPGPDAAFHSERPAWVVGSELRRPMTWMQGPGDHLHFGVGLQERVSRQMPAAGMAAAAPLWVGVGMAASERASLSWQVPIDARRASGDAAQSSWQQGELHLGWNLRPAKSQGGQLKELLSTRIDAQTTLVFKPRAGRAAVVLKSSW